MGGRQTTWWRRTRWVAGAFAAASLFGALAGLSVGRAATRPAATRPAATMTAAESTASPATTPSSTTGPTTTTGSTPSSTATGSTTSSTTTASRTSSTTTAPSTTRPAPTPAGCADCTPVLDLGAVNRPFLGFAYGGRRSAGGGIELVAVIITGDDNPVVSRLIIRLPGRLARDLPTAERHLIRAPGGRLRLTAQTLTVTYPKAQTAATLTIPAAALASSLSTRPRLDVGVTFQVRQGRARRHLGSDVTVG